MGAVKTVQNDSKNPKYFLPRSNSTAGNIIKNRFVAKFEIVDFHEIHF